MTSCLQGQKKEKVLRTTTVYNDLKRILLTQFSERTCHNIIHFYEHVEKTRGLKALFSLMGSYKDRIRELHQRSVSIGGRSLLIKLWNENKITWKGPTKALFQLSLQKNGLDIALQLSQLKGIYVHLSPEKADFYRKQDNLRQFVDPFVDSFIDSGSKLLNREGRLMRRRLNILFPKEIEIAIEKEFGRPLKFLPYPSTLMSNYDKKGRTPYIKLTPSDIVASLDNAPYIISRPNIYKYAQFVFGDILPPIEHYRSLLGDEGFKNDYCGVAVGLRDSSGGDKLRWVYSPIYSFKLLTYPIQDRVSAVLEHIDGCYHTSQQEGVMRIQSWFEEGLSATIYDLSSASDFVPWSVQKEIMSRIFADNEFGEALVELFELVSFSQFIFSQDEDSFLRFLCGTPQGVPGSFPNFMAVIILIIILAEVPKHHRAVVGDDFATPSKYDEKVGYWLDYFHLHISKTKTLWNSDYSEFCSVLVTKQFGIHNVRKAKPIDPDNIIPGILRYGKSTVNVLSEEYTIIDKNILLDYTPKVLFAQMIDACHITDTEVALSFGGYSFKQLGKMLSLSSVEKFSLDVLTALYFSDVSRISVKELIDAQIRMYINKNGKRAQVVTFTLRDELPCFKPPFPPESFYFSLIRKSISEDFNLGKLLLANLHTLHYRVKQQGLLEIKECRPMVNSIGKSALVSLFLKNRNRVIFDQNSMAYRYWEMGSHKREQYEDIAIPHTTHSSMEFEETINNSVERLSKTLDTLKPTAILLQGRQEKSETLLPYHLDMKDETQTQHDLKMGEKLMSVNLAKEIPWYMAMLTKPYSWASYIFTKYF